MPESRLENIVRQLGVYFGIISRDAFTALQIKDATVEGGRVTIPEDDSPEVAAARSLLSVTEGSVTTDQLIEQINGSGASSISEAIKICYKQVDDRANVLLKPGETVGGFLQGTGEGGAPYDLRAIANENTGTDTGDGSESNRRLSMIQVFPRRFTPANRDMGALSLFLRCMPTQEISRAVPFVDMVIIQEGAHLDSNNRISRLSLGQFLLGNARVNPDSAEASYLSANDLQVTSRQRYNADFGNTNNDGTAGQPSPIATAGMELFTAPQTLVPGDEIYREEDATVPGDGSAPGGSGSTDNEELPLSRRAAPVLDRFRPLMTLDSVSFSVVPSGGMMSYKSGKISLTLHDRSRLAEISAFLRPQQYGRTHIQIEYGWAHPDFQAQISPTSSSPGSLIGEFIGSLRVKESYRIVNSSLSFEDSGQVKVEITIATFMGETLRRASISLSDVTADAYQNARSLTRGIQEILERMDTELVTAINGDGNILGSLTDPAGVLSLDREARQQLRRIITLRRPRRPNGSRNNTPASNRELRQLQESLVKLIGRSDRRDGATRERSVGGAAGRLRNSVTRAIRDKINFLKTGSDPFLVGETRSGPRPTNIPGPGGPPQRGSNTYVSLGKVIATFVAGPLDAVDTFGDIQIIFYSFNQKASWMKNRNIATFPIKIEDLETVMEEETDQLVNMTLGGFIQFLVTYFLHDTGAVGYGFGSLYEGRSSEDRTSRQLHRRYQNNEALVFDERQGILRAAYNANPDATLEFKMPTIQFNFTTTPPAPSDPNEGSVEDSGQMVLKLHIFDSQTTSHSTLRSLLEASRTEQIGLINAAAQTAANEGASAADRQAVADRLREAIETGLLTPYPPESPRTNNEVLTGMYQLRGGTAALRAFISRSMPSLRYGESASGVLSADLKSINDPALSTINMQRQGRTPDEPIGSRERGLPLSIVPVELTLRTLGCPLWAFGQQIFVDFGTGTTADNIYGVIGVDHSISQGKFETTVKLAQMQGYAQYRSLFNNLQNMVTAIEGVPESEGDS